MIDSSLRNTSSVNLSDLILFVELLSVLIPSCPTKIYGHKLLLLEIILKVNVPFELTDLY